MQKDQLLQDTKYWRRRAIISELRRKIETPAVLDGSREIEALRSRLHAIETSRSWKLTAPLRALTERVAGIRRRVSKPIVITSVATQDRIQKRISELAQHTTENAISNWQDCLQNNIQAPEIK